MSKKVAVDHGFYVRLFTADGRPAGRFWFKAERPFRRPPNLVRFLRHHPSNGYLQVASITPAKQARRNWT